MMYAIRIFEWYSSVKQLKLGDFGEGPQTKKTLGTYTLTD